MGFPTAINALLCKELTQVHFALGHVPNLFQSGTSGCKNEKKKGPQVPRASAMQVLYTYGCFQN